MLAMDVREFHVAFGHPAAEWPTIQPIERAVRRGEWIVSETQELAEARTITDQADAYLDIIYFAVGGLVELGVTAGPLWNVVQRCNMAKLWDGKPVLNDEGRVQKPPGWEGPENQLRALITAEVEAHLAKARAELTK